MLCCFRADVESQTCEGRLKDLQGKDIENARILISITYITTQQLAILFLQSKGATGVYPLRALSRGLSTSNAAGQGPPRGTYVSEEERKHAGIPLPALAYENASKTTMDHSSRSSMKVERRCPKCSQSLCQDSVGEGGDYCTECNGWFMMPPGKKQVKATQDNGGGGHSRHNRVRLLG